MSDHRTNEPRRLSLRRPAPAARPAPGLLPALLVAGLILGGIDAAAGGAKHKHGHDGSAMKQSSGAASSADLDLRDRTLLDHNGNEVSFVGDVIGDRIVVMDFIFTNCTNICPVLSALMSQVQQKLGQRAGDEVLLVTMTVDPIRDTPERLKAYAAKHGAGEGWTWLTGPKPAVDDVLTGLGAYTANFEDHPSMVLVGDGRSGAWSRFFGFPSPDRIVSRVNELKAAREAAAGG
jgi:protein SCO1/2